MPSGSSFVHLHNHSQFSLLDGAQRLEEMVEQAVRFEMPALAITDHGNLFGAIPFFEAATEKGIKPILGCETYLAPGRRTDRTPQGQGRKPYYHLLLLARDNEGYRNLMRLSTAGFLEGYYYRPRIDREILAQNAAGLIATSTCLGGEIPQLILGGDTARAERVAAEYREIFGAENFFLEIQDQGLPEEKALNPALVDLGRRLSIPLLATNDCHFLRKDDHFAHDILICIQTGKTVKDVDRMRFTQEHYFKSPEEMRQLFRDLPEAVENTLSIAERCSLTLEKGRNLLPHFQVPEGETTEGYFRQVTLDGFERRLRHWTELERQGRLKAPIETYRARLESEIEMVLRMGFPGYFLIVWDFIKYARDQGIPVGPGRGSAAGSLVAYCLQITDVDPLEYGLLFERFLNPERITMPDIDIDFCIRGRGQVIDYVREKYGRDNVAQIITFATMGAKAVIRDAGRGLDVPYGECDRIAKMVPAELDMTIDKALQQAPQLKQLHEKDERIRQLLDVSRRLEGLTRHASVHAAGVVISPRPIVEFSPLGRTKDNEIVTQYAMDEIGSIGLLKMDFLGLKTLTLIQDCVERIGRETGSAPDMERLPLDSPEAYALFAAAKTDGVFQFESSGMKDILRAVPPRSHRLRHDRRLHRAPPRAQADRVHRAAARGHPGSDLRRHRLPGAGDADRLASGRLHPRRGRPAAAGDGQEEARGHGGAARPVRFRRQRARPGRERREEDFRPHGVLRRIRIQQGAQHGLRAGRLSDRLAQGAPSAALHGGSPDGGEGEHRQRRQVRQRLPGHGAAGPGA
jgi:DNA polymerase-3 subunit alpha